MARPTAAPPTAGWSHTPSTLTLVWLAISLPLVMWDTGYVLLRPHTLPGGAWHSPLYEPYALYGRVDLVYSAAAWESRVGFTAAQGTLNVVETAMYLIYVALWAVQGVSPSPGRRKVLTGRSAALATLVVYAATVMTLSKTVLYWLNEYFSDFHNIRHNTPADLITMYIFPNAMWLIFPTIMVYQLGSEIVAALTAASTRPKSE